MSDIDVYSNNPEKYEMFQSLRPDYTKGITFSLELADKYSRNFEVIKIADFCSGTGSNTKKLAEMIKISSATLIDINDSFINLAKKSNIKTKDIEYLASDILEANIDKKHNLNLSIFAYHHVPDDKKDFFVKKIKQSLISKGICILAEIFLESEEDNIKYYENIIRDIPSVNKIDGLESFLNQTATSRNFEFKVSKKFAQNQFTENGFVLIEEVKIYPENNNEKGMFIQVYRLEK